MLRTALLAFIFAVAVLIVEGGVLTVYDNDRSARDACGVAMEVVSRLPRTSLLVSRLPEEALVYLPKNLPRAAGSDSVLLIADDRLHQGDATAHQISTTPAGAVASIQTIPTFGGTRWKIFKLTISPAIPSTDPNPEQSDSPKPATSSSGSPASRESF
jgi:hypothetical protein